MPWLLAATQDDAGQADACTSDHQRIERNATSEHEEALSVTTGVDDQSSLDPLDGQLVEVQTHLMLPV